MDEEAETKAIEKWLRMVDEPLATKEGEKKRTQSQKMNEVVQTSKSFYAVNGCAELRK
jgi:hypothetical protein